MADGRMSGPEARACASCPLGGECLSGVRLFAGVPEASRRELEARAVRSSHPQGDVLVRRGDPIESVLVVRSGRIKTFRLDQDGGEVVLDVLHEGQAIWHGIFLDDATYHYSVGCLTPVELCRIRRADFEQLLDRHPELLRGLLRTVSAELDDAEEKLVTVSIRDPRRRLAWFLVRRDERCVGREIHLKLDDIAGSVGLRPETVSRVITEFERRGLVKRTGRGRLMVTDPDGLRAYAGPVE